MLFLLSWILQEKFDRHIALKNELSQLEFWNANIKGGNPKTVMRFNLYETMKYTLAHLKKNITKDFENSHFVKLGKSEENGIS